MTSPCGFDCASSAKPGFRARLGSEMDTRSGNAPASGPSLAKPLKETAFDRGHKRRGAYRTSATYANAGRSESVRAPRQHALMRLPSNGCQDPRPQT